MKTPTFVSQFLHRPMGRGEFFKYIGVAALFMVSGGLVFRAVADMIQAGNRRQASDQGDRPTEVAVDTKAPAAIREQDLDPELAAKLNAAADLAKDPNRVWTPEAQAKAQGYWVVFGDKPPEKTQMYGVPVIWGRGEGIAQPIPVVPTPPAFDTRQRTVTLPKVVGVQYMMNGREVSGTVPVSGGTTTVTAQALPGYQAVGSASWAQRFA